VRFCLHSESPGPNARPRFYLLDRIQERNIPAPHLDLLARWLGRDASATRFFAVEGAGEQ